jgi:hypothetical protein
MTRRRWGRLLLTVAMLLVAAGLVANHFRWSSLPVYYPESRADLTVSILSQEQYDRVHETFQRPYIVRANHRQSGGAIVVFGASHTRDPHDPQLVRVRELWDEHRPNVALVEGRMGFYIGTTGMAIRRFGEPALVCALADRDGARLYTWETDLAGEVRAVLDAGFPAERVALFYVLRPYFGQRRFGPVSDPESFVAEFVRKRASLPGLAGTIRSVADVDLIWKRDFAGLPDWRQTTDEHGWPGYLNDVAAAANHARDEHFARVLIDLAGRGHRVFAISGSSHAVKIEPAVRGALEPGH